MWCHMMSTLPGERGRIELDRFALQFGLRTLWRDGDHYDLTPIMRAKAVKAGAMQITAQQIVELTRAHKSGQPVPEWAAERQPRLL